MIINDVVINADISEILNELKHQLEINQIHLLHTMRDTPDNVQGMFYNLTVSY